MDIGDLVSYSERAVSGKDLIEALVTLTTLIVPTDPEKIREQTLAIQGKSISSNLFPMTLFDNQGKTIKHVPYLSSEDPKEREVALRFHIIQSTNQRQYLNAHGLIEPARRVIMREHRCGEPELLGLVRHSPFVPGGRERMWARGLAAGFAGDFSLSTHLLLPQIEHGLRELVRAQGVDVARFDKFGQQEDWNLSQLLLDESCGRPHCERILGEALAFDLQALLVEPVGFNLRNRVAHGLVEEGEFEAGPYRYLFWLALYLCLKPLVFAMGKDRAETADGDQASEGATPPDKPS
jgi:hypothetical protein